MHRTALFVMYAFPNAKLDKDWGERQNKNTKCSSSEFVSFLIPNTDHDTECVSDKHPESGVNKETVFCL